MKNKYVPLLKIFFNLTVFVLVLFSLIPAFAEQIQQVSSRTIILLYALVAVFPVISGIVVFFITRGILQGLRNTRNLSKKDKLINVGASVGGFFVILLTVVFQIRSSV